MSCAIAGNPVDGSGSDATATDISVGMDAPPRDTSQDTAPMDDAFSCTGTTCTVANGIGACVNNRCQVGSCNMGYSDLDRAPANGCECQSGTTSTNCGTPSDQMTLAPSGTRMVDGLIATTMGENWLRVTFAPGGHPHITFMTNPGMAYRFDIVRGCMAGSQLTCPDRTAGATALTDWEFFDMPPDGGAADGGVGMPTRNTPAPGTVYIHVTTTMAATGCSKYTLRIAN